MNLFIQLGMTNAWLIPVFNWMAGAGAVFLLLLMPIACIFNIGTARQNSVPALKFMAIAALGITLVEHVIPKAFVAWTLIALPLILGAAAWVALVLWIPAYAGRLDRALSNVENLDRRD